ncbi:MAG: PorT family protein [Muribaculaceae bacterium]|nr:PorT family protein [Muribaculaceae bacterium]
MRLGLVCLLGCLLTLPGVGQTHYEGAIAVGGKAGITLSRVQFMPTVPQTMLPGFVAGAAVRYIEERHFGLIAELNVEQRGWKETFDGAPLAYQRRLTYLQLPLLTHIFFGNNRLHGFFNAGPELGLMIASGTSANFDIEHPESEADFPSVGHPADQFTLPVKKRFDYGLAAGLGMELFTQHRHSLTLEGRFYYGLGDIFGNRKKDAFSASSAMSIMVTLGYYYRVK